MKKYLRIKFFSKNLTILKFLCIPSHKIFLLLILGILAALSSILIIYLIYQVSANFVTREYLPVLEQSKDRMNIINIFINNPGLLMCSVVLNFFIQGFAILYIQKFSQNISHILSTSILQKYLENPVKNRKADTSDNIRSLIASEAQQYATLIIMPFLEIMKSLTLLMMGLATMLLQLPSEALVPLSICVIIFILYYILTRSLIERLGEIRSTAVELRLSFTEASINNSSYLIVYNAVRRMHDRISKVSENLHNAIVWSMLLSNLPKYIVETLVFIGIVTAIIYFDAAGQDLQNADLSGIVFAGLVALRVLPELQRIFNGFARLNYGRPIPDQILSIINTTQNNELSNRKIIGVMKDQRNFLLQLHNVQLFNSANFPIFDPVSFDVRRGEIIVIKGRSGVGKSSLIEAILGSRPINGGSLVIHSDQPSTHVCYVGQRPMLFPGQVKNMFQLIFSGDDDEGIMQNLSSYLVKSGLISSYDETGFFLEKKVEALSGGEQQRLTIVLALLSSYPLIILDEPTSGLDRTSKNRVVEMISSEVHENSRACIVVSHDDCFNRVCNLEIELK